MRTCKLQINGYCDHLGLYAPPELCEVCTRYPGGPNDGKDPKPAPPAPVPVWKVEQNNREVADKAKFTQICQQCEMHAIDGCYYIKRPCQIGKAGHKCPQGRWTAITIEQVEQLKTTP